MRDTCKGLYFTPALGDAAKTSREIHTMQTLGHNGELSLFFLKQVKKHVTCMLVK